MVDMAERQKLHETGRLTGESQAYIKAHNEGLQKAIDWHSRQYNNYAIEELSKLLLNGD